MKVEVSNGELLDKLTILQIKEERIKDSAKLKNIRMELGLLQNLAESLMSGTGQLVDELKAVNGELWEVEDRLRELERSGDFGPAFIELARSVYRLNDRRASIKKRINALTGSEIREEKSYTDY